MRTYLLYSAHPNLAHVTYEAPRWREQRDSMYRIQVRAHSLRQALFLAGNRIEAEGDGEVGIVEIEPPEAGVLCS